MSVKLQEIHTATDPVFSPEQYEKVIEENMGLVGAVVRRFAHSNEETEDLFQIGCVGLIKAARRFDLSFGVRFSTYAVPVILGEIKRHLRDDGALHISRSIKTNAMHIAACIEQSLKNTGNQPTIHELAEKLSLSEEDVLLAMDAVRPVQYLQAEDSESGHALMDTLAAPDTEFCLLERLDLQTALAAMPARDRMLLTMRYYQNKTQSEIAARLGISQVQVSRIEKRLLLDLRKNLTT